MSFRIPPPINDGGIFQLYEFPNVDTEETRAGVTFSEAPGGAIDITVSGGLSADANWSTSAVLWFRLLDSTTNQPVVQGAHLQRFFLDIQQHPANSSNVQLGLVYQDNKSRTDSYMIAEADYSGAGRVVGAARYLSSGTFTEALDTGGAGAFNALLCDPGINVASNLLIHGQCTVIGVESAADPDPGTTPWDLASAGGNLPGATYVGVALRAVGSTTATSARVRLLAFSRSLAVPS